MDAPQAAATPATDTPEPAATPALDTPEVPATPATDEPEAAALQADFFAKLKGHGREIPADRLAGVLAVHRELSRMAALLRQPRPAQSEPAQHFCVARTLAGAQSE